MSKVLLYVPFEQKDEAKKLGAKYDVDLKTWYADEKTQDACIDEWSRRYVEFKYDETERAKSLGCKWDGNVKKWYINKGNANV